MFLYDNKKFKQINEIREKYNLISFSEIMKNCGAGVKPVKDVIKSLAIKNHIILLEPSGRQFALYEKKYLPEITKKIGNEFKNDIIPYNYISKKEFAELFKIKPYTVNNMNVYFSDFNQYAEYFFINNVRTKYFYIDDTTYQFYKEKVDIYTTPFSERMKKKLETPIPTRDYTEGNLHKIAFDYDILAEIFDTKSKHFNLLIKVYKKYAKIQNADSSFNDNHHIIPRFFENYKNIDDLENTIFLPREIHLLVHLLEYRCAFPDYKSKFFSAFCILSGRTDYNKINDNAFNEIEKTICNSLDIY
jgi:hypothetical protein